MTPLHLITGLLGSGKTTLLQHLLKQKPADERWGILINDFGAMGVDAALLSGDQVVEVAGGCLCCSAQLGLQQGLNRLLRHQPSRIFVESSGVSHPQALALALSGLSGTQLSSIIALVTPMQLTPERWQRSEVLRLLVTLADHLILNKVDLAAADTLAQARHLLEQLPGEPIQWLEAVHSRIPLEPLLSTPPRPLRIFTSSSHAADCSTPHPANLPALLQAQAVRDETFLAIGYRFSPVAIFNRTILNTLLSEHGVYRAKGLLRTGMAWNLLQFSDGHMQWQPHGGRLDSRLIIFWPSETTKHAIEAFEHTLASGITLKEH